MAQPSRPWAGPGVGAERRAIAHWRLRSLPAARWALRLGAVAVAGSWLGFYLITRLPFLDLEAFRSTVVLHAVTGAIFIPYLASLIIRRRLPGGSALDLPLVALLSVYLAATAASLDWRLSLEVTLTALMAAGVFYVLSDGRVLQRWQLEAAFMLAVLAAAAWALWEVGNDYADWLRLSDAVRGGLSLGDLVPPTVPKVHDVGDHPNLLGGIFAMSLPFFFAGLFRRLPGALKVGIALAGVAVAAALFFALARSAWLGAATGVVVTAALLAATPAGLQRLRRLRPKTAQERWVAGTLALGLLAVLGAGALVLASTVQSRPIWLFRESGTPRLDVMEAGAAMVRDHPALGTGPGVYGLLYPEYSGKYPNHAFHSHNGYLQSAVDMGAPGAIATLALAGALGWLLVRGLRETEGEARLSLAAAAGGCTAFAVFSLLDAPNEFKGPLVALAAVGAIAVLSDREGRPPEDALAVTQAPRSAARAGHLLARLAVPVALAGLLITWGRLDLAHYAYSNGVSSANAGHWEQAIDEAQRAVDLDPQFAVYRLELGTIEGQAYLDTGDRRLLADGIHELRRAVELEPRSAIGHANLARLLAESGDHDGARQHALAAVEFANNDPAVVLAAAGALEATGWQEDAVLTYAHVLYLDINLVDSPFWTSSAFRREHFDEITGRSAIVFNACGILHLYSAGVPSLPVGRDEAYAACAQRAADNPGDAGTRVALAEALLVDGAYDDAFAHLDDTLDRAPDYGPARTLLGRWYAAQGQVEDARREWLRAGQLGEVEALVLLGDSYPAGEVPPEVVDALRSELRGATSQVQFHLTGILYYRFKFFRASPITILLPGEWQEAVPARYAEARDALERWTGGG